MPEVPIPLARMAAIVLVKTATMDLARMTTTVLVKTAIMDLIRMATTVLVKMVTMDLVRMEPTALAKMVTMDLVRMEPTGLATMPATIPVQGGVHHQGPTLIFPDQVRSMMGHNDCLAVLPIEDSEVTNSSRQGHSSQNALKEEKGWARDVLTILGQGWDLVHL